MSPERIRAAEVVRIEPRGLRREDAARYVGLGVTKFDELVADGRMPRPFRIDGRVVWDRRRLDDAFDALSDRGDRELEFVA